jgi:hypothetical protein
MQLARSRLNRNQPDQVTHHLQVNKPANLKNKKLGNLVKDYLKLIPTLTIAMISYFLLWLLINYVYPEKIQNWLFPNSYLPFQLLLGLGNFFLFSFIGKRKLWGFLSSVLLGWLVLLKLQKITIDFWAVLSAVSLALVASFWWLIIQHFNRKKRNS